MTSDIIRRVVALLPPFTALTWHYLTFLLTSSSPSTSTIILPMQWSVGSGSERCGSCLGTHLEGAPRKGEGITIYHFQNRNIIQIFKNWLKSGYSVFTLKGVVKRPSGEASKKLFFYFWFLTTTVFSDKDFLDWARPPPPNKKWSEMVKNGQKIWVLSDKDFLD